MPALPHPVIGCDIGKTTIVVFDSGSSRLSSIANQSEALADFANSLPPDGLVICEATGGHGALLLDALARAGRFAHRADARR